MAAWCGHAGNGGRSMLVSTRGRYALRVLIDLAEHNTGTYIPMKDVAERQDISLKYLERIMPSLTKAKIIEGVHGKGGGYRLTRDPSEITVFEILELTEESLAPVGCLVEGAPPCPKVGECKTVGMWNGLYSTMKEYLTGFTISDLAKPGEYEYII